MAMGLDLDTFLAALYVIVDDIYQSHIVFHVSGYTVGA
jgi:hypothetical protein